MLAMLSPILVFGLVIFVHELGHFIAAKAVGVYAPLAGETIYDRLPHGAPVPDPSGAPRLALHAASLGIVHPRSGERMQWISPLPRDLAAVVRRLRESR